jgi:PKD repeat protein
MKLKVIMAAWVLLFVFQPFTWAGDVPLSRAVIVAGNFIKKSSVIRSLDFPGNVPVQLSFAKKQEGKTLYYVFSFPEHEGFIIVAADDRVPPVLGYSLTGTCQVTPEPPAYTGFMQAIEKEILTAISGNTPPLEATTEKWKDLESSPFFVEKPVHMIPPLIATRWDQGCFYNAGCPNDTAAATTCLHALAGSGAVAMAQIMKYYQYPAHGTGEHGYTHPKYGIQYANFGATSYNYSAMPDSLTGPDDMVSALVYQVGVAQNMNFNVTFSSSDSAAIDSAFVKYFGYPETSAWKWSANYAAADWLTMLKTELDASHPLIYHSFDLNGRHNFYICDGYQDAGYFHFNWGWGGAYDGYYYLDSLFPGGNYTIGQGAIFNLAPGTQTPDSYLMDFESVTDFSLTFNDWTVKDMDHHDTYGFTNFTFPHQFEPLAFLCFNPAQVVPSMATDQAIQPHGGQRFGACFSSNPPSNNDWFISPQIQLGANGNFSFWIKSYTDKYKVDDYFVAVSTTDNNPASFTTISGTDTLHTTTAWVKKTFSLSAYNNQRVYVAIHCVSNDHYLMMIDDLEIKTKGSSSVKADFSVDKSSPMAGESVNFTDLSVGGPTSWSWTFTGATPATSTVQNPTGIVYQTPGTHPVTLKVSNGTSSDLITKPNFISVSAHPSSMSLDFESVADFSLTFLPWTVNDVLGGNTYGIVSNTGISYIFPHTNDSMTYICFNPSKTTPAMTDLLPHAGQKLGCCFSTVPSVPPAPAVTPNDKWLISPKMTLGINPKIEFWVKSYSTQYGNEMYNVAVSTTGLEPASFVALTATPESAPADWTKRSYDLPAYANQNVYIGIQCVTNDGFIFMIDDIAITSTVGVAEQGKFGQFSLYPNPARDRLTLQSENAVQSPVTLELINTLGEKTRSWREAVFNGTMTIGLRDVPEGMYILRITAGNETVNRKITIIN